MRANGAIIFYCHLLYYRRWWRQENSDCHIAKRVPHYRDPSRASNDTFDGVYSYATVQALSSSWIGSTPQIGSVGVIIHSGGRGNLMIFPQTVTFENVEI